MRRFCLLSLALSGLLSALPLAAQDARGSILGRVVDASGAVMPGVHVRAIHVSTSVTTESESNNEGNYVIPYLAPGIYRVEAEAAGFKKYVRDNVEVNVNGRVAIEIALEPGQITEQVTVTSTAAPLDTTTGTMGQVVDHRRLTELPLSGGDAFTLTRLSPGVLNFAIPNHPSLAPAVEVISNVAINGTRDHNSEYTIDGAPTMWGTNAGFVPPSDMVEEFKVQTTTYDASLGHAAGGLVNVALRSGTNQLHGTLSEFHNDNVLQGMDLFQRQYLYNPATGPINNAKRKQVAPQNVMNRFGAIGGGPLLLPKLYDGRNRTFWTFGYEGFRRPGTERGNYFFNVPTLAEREGDFSALLPQGPVYQIYDPATIAPAPGGRFSRQPFPNNLIPKSRFDATASGLLQYYPLPNVAGTALGENNFFGPQSSINNYNSETARVDHNLSSRQRIFGRYSQMHQLFQSGQTLPNITTGNVRDRYSKGFGFDDVYTFSPSFLLNFRYSFTRFIQTNAPLAMGFNLASAGFSPTLVAEVDPQALTFPQINVTGAVQLGNSWPNGQFTNYHTWSADFTKIWGRHSFRFGPEFRLYRESNRTFNYGTPSITFGTTWTAGPLDNSPAAPIGQGLASFLLGIPTGGQLTVNASYADQSTYSGFYLQDDWKITQKLTLNLGLRYEYEGPLTERYNRSIRAFDFSSANPLQAQAAAAYAQSPIPQILPAGFRVPGGPLFAGAGGQPRALWDADTNNVAPRIGFAWSLTPATVVRGGYGIFYVPIGADRRNANQSGFSQTTSVVASTDNGQHFIASLANPLPGGILQPAGASLGLLTNAGQTVSFFYPNGLNPYTQQWSLGVQREVAKNTVVEVGYAGNRANKLGATRQFDPVPAQYLSTSPVRDQATINLLTQQVLNPFYPQLPGTGLAGRNVALSQLLRPYPQFTGITASLPVGFSWYHALQARAERRFGSGFEIQGSYTWSKFMDATAFNNPTDASPEHVISDEDRTQRFSASGVWSLPFGPGHRFGSGTHGAVAMLVGGWQFQGVFEAQSGPPLGFGNALLYASPTQIALAHDQQTLNRWFDTSVFERSSALQLANNIQSFSTRFTGIRGPNVLNWNLSGIKEFTVRERVRLQFRSEWLNALNHSALANPNTSPTSSLFGTISATNGYPRQIYFALKLMF